MSCPRPPRELAGGCHLHLGPRSRKSLPLDGHLPPIHTWAEAAGPCTAPRPPARPPVPLHRSARAGQGVGGGSGETTLMSRIKKKRRKTTIRPRGLSCLGGSRCRRVTETRLDMLAGGSKGRFCGRRKESTGSAPFEKRVSRVQQGDFIFFKGQCLNLRSDPPGERACGRPRSALPPATPAWLLRCPGASVLPLLDLGWPTPPPPSALARGHQLSQTPPGGAPSQPPGHPHCLR